MRLADRVRSRLVINHSETSPAEVSAALLDEGIVLGEGALMSLIAELRREYLGAGPLEALIHQADVTDVLVNGPNEVWIDRGRGMERAALTFSGEEEVRALAQRLAASVSRRLDEASPFVDARLESGIRLHAVLAPISLDGTLISIRIPRARAFTLDDLVSSGSVDEEGAAWLRAVIDSRVAFLISGGTGSGKTTILGALLGLMPTQERLVIVEDSAELQPDHPHAIRLQARPANLEGAGAITMQSLVRQTLRMRPDRIVVGEVRGAEVIDLLTALNTGHEGGCGTIHANSAADVPARIEALGLQAGLGREAVHALLAAGLSVVIHLARDSTGLRVVQGVHVLVLDEHSRVRARAALIRVGTRLEPGEGMQQLSEVLASSSPPAHIALQCSI
ncbi:MAG: TadA family conjugal transfer-associated ATPase [Actinomycetota bacterium]|nr:TadA family conjugal transfer-associated ATPase [Actinomycetota bacterium]